MIRAIYIKDSAGAYIFAAAFAIDEDRYDGDIAETLAENLRQEGEDVLIVKNCKLNNLYEVFKP